MQQASLLSLLASTPGSTLSLAGVMPAVRAAMNRVANEYAEGRKMLVDAINEVARRECVPLTRSGGKSVTLDQLNKFLQPGEQGHTPDPYFILCFCAATRDCSPLEPLWKPFGLIVIPAADLPLLEYGRTCADINKTSDTLSKAKERKKKLEALLQ